MNKRFICQFHHGSNVRLLKMDEVIILTGMCRASIYNGMRDGTFIKSVRVGPRSIRFLESEVHMWIAERLRQRDAGKGESHEPS